MKKSFFFKKRLSTLLETAILLLVAVFVSFYRAVFAKRTVLFVGSKKIHSITFGPFLQFCLVVLFVWVGNLLFQSLNYDRIINEKSEEISRLKSSNNFFEKEFVNINEKLKKVNEYLFSISGEPQQVKGEELDFRKPENFKIDELSRDEKKTLKEIKISEEKLRNVQSVAQQRIKKIEAAIALTGLNVKKIPAHLQKNSDSNGEEVSLNKSNQLSQGGPFIPLDSVRSSLASPSKFFSFSGEDFERRLERMKFSSEIDRLMVLEKLIEVLPLARPMKNYYISSGFGTRQDPITGKKAMHQGLDFVGSNQAKIISPSKGVVVLAGRFSNYGNAVVVDHGFGITTRYGHLSEVKVKNGQIVKKGDLLALQGSTGRSTGDHLHYEIRYKGIALNPRKFLEAGDELKNDEKSLNHVDI